MKFIPVTERLPPACAEVLVIKPVTRYGRVMNRAVMEYIGIQPADDVVDEGSTHWCAIEYPDDVEMGSRKA